MTKFNTRLRLAYTLIVLFLSAQPSFAQTVLNFAKASISDRLNASFAVINPTNNFAEVQFTLYGLDGAPAASVLANPVRYRIAPKGQLSMRANELFATTSADGWVQMTSGTTGLSGFYLSGDFAGSLGGSESAGQMTSQVIPGIREDQRNHTELVLLNPGTAASNLNLVFYNSRGDELTSTSRSLDGHAALRLRIASLLTNPPADIISARITSSTAVSAVAIIERDSTLQFVMGQSADDPATARVAPDFISGNGFDPHLILTNPNGAPVQVNVTFFGENGGAPLASLPGPVSRPFTIPKYGSLAINTVDVVGRLLLTPINGWLRVDSSNVALNGLVTLDQGRSIVSVPLQTVSLNRGVFGNIYGDTTTTACTFVNPTGNPAVLEASLVHEDGTTAAQNTLNVSPSSKYSQLVSDIFQSTASRKGDYLFIRSTEALYTTCVLASSNIVLASMPPGRTSPAFAPNAIGFVPAIVGVEPGREVRPGTTLRVNLNVVDNTVFLLADQVLQPRQLAPGIPTFLIDIPNIEPGFANLRIRYNGVESAPVTLQILPSTSGPLQNVSGRAFYQKVDVSDLGLDFRNPVMMPIRNARIELISTTTQSIVAVSETDSIGRFAIPAPLDANLSIRILSRLRSSNLRVADNTNLNALYVTPANVDGRSATADLIITETSRQSGAFNILEQIQRANETLRTGDPGLVPPPVTIFWSTRNTNRSGSPTTGLIGTTTFNVATNTAYILGDRATDSDEFDDAVIIHEYGHMIASRFSRDDSPGGPHLVGDMLDPRIAWSEGWANFFSSAVRNDSVWRDSYGPNGANVIRHDLEENVPTGDNPGYWSEASVGSILWDLFDDHVDPGDEVQYPFSSIWVAFTDLHDHPFVYLPYFLEQFMAREQGSIDAVRMMAQSRSIDFQPNVRPSVTNPFPTPMNIGSAMNGFVDSVSTKRTNLITSSHFYSFTTSGGAASIRLDVTGLGPGGNPNANDLDLFLLDGGGRVIDKSDGALNGQSERIALRLNGGTYFVEIRSYYTNAETALTIFNSGSYRLTTSIQ